MASQVYLGTAELVAHQVIVASHHSLATRDSVVHPVSLALAAIAAP